MKQFIKNTFTPGQAGKTFLLGLLMAISGAAGSLHAADTDIVLEAEEAGTLYIGNKWTTAVSILKDATYQGDIDANQMISLDVDAGDVIIVQESNSGSTFREWSETDIPLVLDVPCKITSMPTMSAFTSDTGGTTAGDNFFQAFNVTGSLTSLPAGSFNTENITSVGDGFFAFFNQAGSLTSLPDGSFNTANITSVGNYFFAVFNNAGLLRSLPDGSFNTENITSVGDGFFDSFNYEGSLVSLPDGSFNTENITSVGDGFFIAFNQAGSLTSLPAGSFNTENITSVGDLFFTSFNSSGSLNKVPISFKLPKALTTVGRDYCTSMFSDSPMTAGIQPLYFYAEAVEAFLGTADITPTTVPARTTVYVNAGPATWIGDGRGTSPQTTLSAADKHRWSIASNWIGGAAPADGAAIIYHADAIDLHVDGIHTAASISNATTAGLTVLSGASLTITEWDANDNVTTGGGSILIKAEEGGKANGTFLVPDGSTVNAAVEFQTRAISTDVSLVSKMAWQFFGVPVTSYGAKNLHGAYIRKFLHTETTGDDTEGYVHTYWDWLTNASTIQAFGGYEISVGPSHTGKFTFSGQLLTADKEYTVEYSDKDYFSGQWVLSNSFTAGVKVSDIDFESGKFEESVWLFNTGSSVDWKDAGAPTEGASAPGQYTVIPKATGKVIPSMQGFVVKLSGTADGIITLPYPTAAATMPTMRSQQKQRGAQPAQDMQEVHEKIYTDIALLSGDGLLKDRMQLYTDPRTTRNYDNGWDGRKMFGAANLAALFSPELDGNYQVNALPSVDNTYLSMKAETGTRDYALRFVHHNTADTYTELWLRDLELGIDVDITADSSVYHFTAANEKAATRRFRITSTRSDGDEGAATGIEVYRNSTTDFLVRNHYTTAVVLHIYSASGHLLASREVPPLSDTSLPGSDFPQGVYLVEGRTESGARSVVKMVSQ